METIAELVEALRTEIGLAPDDASQDAWLEARVNGILAAARRFARRHLWPVASFRDVFANEQPCCCPCGMPAAILAETPVQELTAITIDGAPADVADFEVSKSGRLYRINAGGVPVPVFAFLTLSTEYTAGFVNLPADIFEAIAAIIRQAWGASSAGQAAGADPLLGVSRVTVFDVASVEYSDAGGAYYESSVPKSGNAILGPWTSVFYPYRDYARGIGLPRQRESELLADPA